MRQRWIVYSFIVARVVFLILLFAFVLQPGYFLASLSEAITEVHSPSYRSIFRAITIFRTLHHWFVPVVIFILVLPATYLLNRFLHRKYLWMDAAVVASLSYVIFQSLVIELPPAYLLAYFLLAYFVLKLNSIRLENRRDSFHFSIAPAYVGIPFLPEMIFPWFLVFHLRQIRTQNGGLSHVLLRYGAIAISANLMISIFTFWNIKGRMFDDFHFEKKFRKAERIIDGDFYTMNVDAQTERLFAAGKGDGLLYVFDLKNRNSLLQKMKLGAGEVQDVRTNEEKREFYYFDRITGLVLVYDMDTFQLRRRSKQGLEGTGSAKIAFDNNSETLLVIREFDVLWILDLQSLRPIRKLPIGDRIESAVFSERLNRYLLTYFEKYPFMRLLSPDGNQIQELPLPQAQATVTFSNKTQEFYVALPLRGQIFVFDMKTLSLKRKTGTVTGVRGIAVADKKNILVGVSMFNGYADLIDLRTNRSLCRRFTGYYLRDVVLDVQQENAFISSMLGGIYRMGLGCNP